MLGKLLKNEVIQIGRIFAWLLGGGIVIGGVGVLFTMTQDTSSAQFLMAFMWNFLLILGASALQMLSIVMILVSTNRSLFSERGYLTFALPVASWKMLLAKVMTNVLFMVASMAEAVGLLYVAVYNFRRLISSAGTEVLETMGEGFSPDMFGDILGLPSFSDILKFAGFLLIVFLVFMILVMMGALFVLTISHVRPFQNKPALWMPIFFLALGVACQQLVSQLSKLIPLNVTLGFSGFMENQNVSVNMTSAVVMLGVTVGLFFLTNWLFKRKISLK